MTQETNAHSKYSPSGIAMYATCPGYVKKPMTPEEEDDDFSPANVGTRIHKALELRDESILLSGYERNLYSTALNHYEELLNNVRHAVAPEADNVKEILLEHCFNGLVFDPEEGKQTGTADVLIRFNNGLSVIVDWKTGQVPVAPPDRNPQFIAYGLLEFAENPKCNQIILAVIQPTVQPRMQLALFNRHAGYAPVKGFEDILEVPYDECDAKAALQSTIIRHKRDANNPFAYASCPSVCPYCKRLGECNKITDNAKKFAYHCIDDEVLKAKLLDSTGSALNNVETLSAMLDFTKIMESAQKQYKEYAKQCLACGVDIPGWKVSNRGQSVMVDKEAFLAFMIQELGDHDLVDNLKSIPVAHFLEVLVNKKHPDADKVEKKDAMTNLITELTELGVVSAVETKSALLQTKR